MDLEQMWQSTLGEMEVQLTKAHFATWLKNSRPIDKKDDTLFVALPSNFAKTWVEEKYQKNIIGIVRNMDTSVKKIEFVVGNKNISFNKAPSEHNKMPPPSWTSIKLTRKRGLIQNIPSRRLLLGPQMNLPLPPPPRSPKGPVKNIILFLSMAASALERPISSKRSATNLMQSTKER
jgi:chromosomal replication initiation ATPase DnaA